MVHLRATGDAPILKQAKFKVFSYLTVLVFKSNLNWGFENPFWIFHVFISWLLRTLLIASYVGEDYLVKVGIFEKIVVS